MRLHLRPEAPSRVARTEPAEPGLRIDFDAHGRALALEIAAGEPVEPARIDRVLAAVGEPPLGPEERASMPPRGPSGPDSAPEGRG